MEKKLRLYFNDGYIDYKLLEAMKMLKEFKTFSVFCAFIDPRTDIGNFVRRLQTSEF